MMSNPLSRRLARFAALTAEDHALLEDAGGERVRRVGAREDVFREGDRPRCLYLVLDGWAMRYKSLEDGRRQVLSFALPGDICDQHVLLLSRADHSMSALSATSVAEISATRISEIARASPRLLYALCLSNLVGQASQREWTINLGQRTALERMAHLICELFFRLRAIGLTHGNTCELPVTQATLADATGISAVHVNRTLQELRASNLITLRGKHLTIDDIEGLQSVALFNPGYLHLDEVERATQTARDGEPTTPPLLLAALAADGG